MTGLGARRGATSLMGFAGLVAVGALVYMVMFGLVPPRVSYQGLRCMPTAWVDYGPTSIYARIFAGFLFLAAVGSLLAIRIFGRQVAALFACSGDAPGLVPSAVRLVAPVQAWVSLVAIPFGLATFVLLLRRQSDQGQYHATLDLVLLGTVWTNLFVVLPGLCLWGCRDRRLAVLWWTLIPGSLAAFGYASIHETLRGGVAVEMACVQILAGLAYLLFHRRTSMPAALVGAVAALLFTGLVLYREGGSAWFEEALRSATLEHRWPATQRATGPGGGSDKGGTAPESLDDLLGKSGKSGDMLPI